MLFSTNALLVAPLLLAVAVDASSCAKGSTHRRHHHKHRKTQSGHKGVSVVSSSSSSAAAAASVTPVLAAKFAQNAKASSSSSSSAPASSSTASSSSSSSSSSTGWGLSGLSKNGIFVGMLPDDGSGGGSAQTISTLNSALGGKAAAQGWYAQAQSGTTFTGSQLTSRMDQIKQGGVFQPAVMPTGGWQGLTYNDNSQAKAICTVMKQFTDQGIEVWLRFAHEVNWYQQDGTYEGDVSDFKEGWAVVAAACKSIAPEVKMFFTPNVADLATYEKFYPDDPSTVDVIGIDYYPSTATPPAGDFVAKMKPFHDKYCSDSTIFAIGEIGLGKSASIAQRLAWFEQITSSATASAMPYFKSVSWFNYMKGYDFRIAGVSGDTVTKNYLA